MASNRYRYRNRLRITVQSLACLPLLALACAGPKAQVAADVGLTSLGDGEAVLRSAFNARSDAPQLLLILSPT
jgi:hypothetical protein